MQKETKTKLNCFQNQFIKKPHYSLKPTISESVKGLCTNFWYKIGGESILTNKKSSKFKNLVLLGNKYTSYQLAQQKFKLLFWFTYRRQMKICGSIKSDLGWGCLIRVGQMLLANSLKRYFENSSTKANEENIIICTFQQKLAFLDDHDNTIGKYSFQKIFQKGKEKFKLKIGDWFNLSQICYILMSLQNYSPMKGSEGFKMICFNQTLIFLDEIFKTIGLPMCDCNQRKIMCKNCHRGTEYIKNSKQFAIQNNTDIMEVSLDFQYLNIDDYNENSFYASDNSEQEEKQQEDQRQILRLQQKAVKEQEQRNNREAEQEQEVGQKQEVRQKQEAESKQKTNQKQEININIKESQKKSQQFTSNFYLKNQEQTKNIKFDLLLVVTTRISQDTIDQKSFKAILELMSLPSSLGAIGGVPGKGLYFVGAFDDNLIYLDPHLVQNQVNTFNLAKGMKSFHCQNMRTISRQKLDPSIAFAFYIGSLSDLSNLIKAIQKIKKENPEAYPISYMWENEFREDENDISKISQCEMDQYSPQFQFYV